MKHVYGEPDISEWEVSALSGIEMKMKEALAEVMHEALSSDNSYVYFPAEWSPNSDGLGGGSVSDPLTVYLRVGLDVGEEKPTYAFNLRDELSDSIKDCRFDGSFSEGLERISLAFKQLSKEIDDAIDEHRSKKPPTTPTDG